MKPAPCPEPATPTPERKRRDPRVGEAVVESRPAAARTPRLGALVGGRDNNFNLIRMVAASCVLVSHAESIVHGPDVVEPLEVFFHGTTLGNFAVMVFFAISGFLIARSFDRSPGLVRFFLARFLRLYPALVVVLVVTVTVAGLGLTDSTMREFAPAGLKYVGANLSLYRPIWSLPGVFGENPLGPAINGSLWTLSHEVTCYLGVVALGLVGALRSKRRMLPFLVLFICAYAYLQSAGSDGRLEQLTYLAGPFAVGAALYVWRDSVPLSFSVGTGLAIATAVAHPTPFFTGALSISSAYWVFLLAYLPGGRIRRYNALGDYSYGVYLFAFPIQQLVVDLEPSMSPLANIAVSFPLTLVCAILSWKLVEAPSLALLRRRDARAA